MSIMTFYTEANFQGTSLDVDTHVGIELYINNEWLFRSVKVNNNKLLINATYSDFDPVDRQENISSEDVPDLVSLISVKDTLYTVQAFNLNSDDIIVAMDGQCNMRGFRVRIDSEAQQLPLMFSSCYGNYTTDAIPGTLTILNAETMLSSSFFLTCQSSEISPAGIVGTDYGSSNLATAEYSPESQNVTITTNMKDVTVSVEKVDDHHFLAHIDHVVGIRDHCILHTDEDYRNTNNITPNATFVDIRREDGTWNYKSMEVISDSTYKTAWLWTNYPLGGEGYDMNQYRSFATYSSIPELPAIFDSASSNLVTLIYNENPLPVFLRLTNTDASANWTDFVIESQFTTALLSINPPEDYHTFCANNPAALQPGVVSIISYNNALMDYDACVLRYGSLSADGVTATWNGSTTLNIEYASADTLTLSLGEDAPADWEITAITKGDYCWYVDLTGSAAPAA